MTVENRMLGANLAATYNVVTPRVELAVRSITGSSQQGPSSVVQNPGRIDFMGSTENTPPMPVSSRLDSKVDQDRYDVTLNAKIS